MPASLDALDFLDKPPKGWSAAVVVLHGDESFLMRLVRREICKQVLGEGDAVFSQTVFDGRSIAWRDVADELSTPALFGGGRRLIVVEEAGDWISAHRSTLEQYVEQPKSTGVLLIETESWPSNTRLFKAVDKKGLAIQCAAPRRAKLESWLVSWARREHQAKLEPEAAEKLVELAGLEPGLLDTELAKLAAYAGPQAVITAAMVDDLVGGWRAKTTWEMLDSLMEGNAVEALGQLDRLLVAGENPVGILAQISTSMRRFATATRLIEGGESTGRRLPLRTALQQAGVPPFVLGKSEAQLRKLGRQKAKQLTAWLLECDLELKGASSMPPRLVLERLLMRVATDAASPRQTATSGPGARR